MTFLEYLVVGSYLYTSAVFVYLLRLVRNHLIHRVKRLERLMGIQPGDNDVIDAP